jgi:hypothetical protein
MNKKLIFLTSFLLPLRLSKSIQITVARFSHDEELLWTGGLVVVV